jgi:Holliday junction resolvasome RuvABC endonuclease subunit
MNDLTILALDCSSTTIGVCYDGRILPTIHLKSPQIFIRCDLACQAISHLLADHHDNVDLVIMEAPASRFKGALIPQCRVQGAIGRHLAHMGIAIQELSPQAGKMMLTGKGNADKPTMIAHAYRHVPQPIVIDEHGADAFALWLCGKQLKVEREAV